MKAQSLLLGPQHDTWGRAQRNALFSHDRDQAGVPYDPPPPQKGRGRPHSEARRSHGRLCGPVDCSPPGCPLSMGFSRQEGWSGLPLPSPGDLPDPGIKPGSPELQAGSLTSEPPGKEAAKSFMEGSSSRPLLTFGQLSDFFLHMLNCPRTLPDTRAQLSSKTDLSRGLGRAWHHPWWGYPSGGGCPSGGCPSGGVSLWWGCPSGGCPSDWGSPLVGVPLWGGAPLVGVPL